MSHLTVTGHGGDCGGLAEVVMQIHIPIDHLQRIDPVVLARAQQEATQSAYDAVMALQEGKIWD